MKLSIALLSGLTLWYATQTGALTTDDISSIKNDVKSLVAATITLQAAALRLIFHDCVSGCDGCINVDNDSNAGLSTVITALETVYENYNTTLSRADFWALAAIAAIERGTARANNGCSADDCINVPDITFQYGRTDCSTAPYTDDTYTFPEPTMNRTAMYSYFEDNFGFSEDEVTALMGAHTFGRAIKPNSGYSGNWIVGGASRFDNEFYKLMFDTNNTWENVDVAQRGVDPKFEWIGYDSSGVRLGMMLNTDVELLYDLVLDDDDFSSSCNFSTCPQADSYALAYTYATDADTWATDFVAVFEKMIMHGYDSLTDV